MRTSRFSFLVLAAVATLAACAGQKQEAERTTPSEVTIAESESVDRARQGAADDAKIVRGIEELVASNNRFAFDLFKSIPPGDTFVSPHGVASALAIVYAGADGDTATEIQKTLRARMGERDLHSRFEILHGALRQREEEGSPHEERGFKLRVVNGVWHDDSVTPRPEFLRIAQGQHLAEVESLSFRTKPEAAIERINEHVDDATRGKIQQLVGPDTVNALTRVVVTNAVYFDAPWLSPFSREATTQEEFAAPSGARSVPMMRQVGRFRYFEGKDVQVVALPYGTGDVEALILLPQGDASTFGDGLDADYFQWLVGQTSPRQVDVAMPRFELQSKVDLRRVLQAMGMQKAFVPEQADFGNLAAEGEFFISAMVHEARVRVDEEGTEAAAATAAVASVTSMPAEPPVEFRADRPFLVAIRDVPTGALLFLGRVLEP